MKMQYNERIPQEEEAAFDPARDLTTLSACAKVYWTLMSKWSGQLPKVALTVEEAFEYIRHLDAALEGRLGDDRDKDKRIGRLRKRLADLKDSIVRHGTTQRKRRAG